MNEMQERVTAAIMGAFEHIEDVNYRYTIAGCWARAAMEAMLRPTDAMCEAGYKADTGGYGAHFDNQRELHRGRTEAAWKAMVRAALEPHPHCP